MANSETAGLKHPLKPIASKPAPLKPAKLEKVTHALLFSSIVLVGTLLLISYFLTFFNENAAQHIYLPIKNLIVLLHKNWSVLVIIPLVMFYYSIYGLIQRIKEFGGLKFHEAEMEKKELSEEDTKNFEAALAKESKES